MKKIRGRDENGVDLKSIVNIPAIEERDQIEQWLLGGTEKDTC